LAGPAWWAACAFKLPVAVSVGAIGNDAAAQSTVEQTQASPKGGLTNRYETQSSELDFRLGDHQQLKRILLDGSRDRLR
jgi:hypothetical protein